MSRNIFGLNFHFVLREIGFLLGIEAVFIFGSGILSLYYGAWDAHYLFISGGITLAGGVLLGLIGTRGRSRQIGKREGALTVTLAWIFFALFGMLPYYLSGAIPSVTNAFFETMSGLTTTGASILTDVEQMPKGLLFWRSVTQWLGGLGMIVFVLAFLPFIGVGGVAHLYDAEVSGITHDKFRPRVGQVAKRLWGIYVLLTFVLTILLWMGPMTFFDAVCHALATMSTGGFSTKNLSVAYWNSSYIDYVISIFMLIGATNFTLIYFCFKGQFKRMWRDEELRWFLGIVLFATLVVTAGLMITNQMQGVDLAFRHALFQVTTIISTTGFSTSNFIVWGPFFWIVFCLLMLISGCAGSTSGGMKTVRLVVLAKNTGNEFQKQIHPRAILPVRLNQHVVSVDVVQRILAFAFLYIVIVLLSCLFFTMTGMGFEESFGSALTAMSNTGPGLGIVGPAGNFADIPVVSKWFFSFLMITGRLEIFTVLMLFAPAFWKK